MELAYANDLPSAVFDLLADVRAYFFDKFFIPIFENGMKPGDKVWVFDDFDAPEIKEATLISVGQEKGKRAKFFFVFKDNPHMEFWSHNVFPTREALCEHYRKIFE